MSVESVPDERGDGMPVIERDPFREHLEREAAAAKRYLREAAAAIADDLGRLARQLEDRDVLVSELGELQGRGPQFDIACSRYMRARRLLEDYDKFQEAALNAR